MLPIDMIIGTMHKTSNYGTLEVIKYTNARSVLVMFVVTKTKINTTSSAIRTGMVKDCFYPNVRVVGFIGEGRHKATKDRKVTRAYSTWSAMLERCYCNKSLEEKPTYKGCSVVIEWHNFQTFADWYYSNVIYGFELDKDIKVESNKIYGPETCVFVSHKDNAIKARAKSYAFINPKGEKVCMHNLAEFCRNNDLHKAHMVAVNNGKLPHHKQWTRFVD